MGAVHAAGWERRRQRPPRLRGNGRIGAPRARGYIIHGHTRTGVLWEEDAGFGAHDVLPVLLSTIISSDDDVKLVVETTNKHLACCRSDRKGQSVI